MKRQGTAPHPAIALGVLGLIVAGLLFAVALTLLPGCTYTIDQFPGLIPGTGITTAIVERVAPQQAILRPKLANNGDDWYVNGGDEIMLRWATDRDQYGNPTGLTDDTNWGLFEVIINCPERGAANDTIFTPGDPQRRLGYLSADGEPNAVLWWVAYVAPIEAISGLPRTPYPRAGGYPPLCFQDSLGIPSMPSQEATIRARAHARRLQICITLPPSTETYTVDLPGASPTSSNEIELIIGESGTLTIHRSDGEIYTVDVPEDWFWISGEWTIPVGPYVGC